MSRNGGIATTFRAALVQRTAPNTGVTVKMLANRTGYSEDTLARARDDATTIAGALIDKVDAALSGFGFPGFLDDVFGAQRSHVAPPVSNTPTATDLGRHPAAEETGLLSSTADLCWWVTHEGTLHSAAFGHSPFARQYFGLPADTAADARKFALEQMGWLAATRFADGRLALDGRADRARPESIRRLCAWLDQQSRHGCRSITGTLLGAELTLPDAVAGIEALQTPAAPASIWTAEQLTIDAV